MDFSQVAWLMSRRAKATLLGCTTRAARGRALSLQRSESILCGRRPPESRGAAAALLYRVSCESLIAGMCRPQDEAPGSTRVRGQVSGEAGVGR